MKFAIINDIHNGPPNSGFIRGIQRKLTHKAEDLVSQFIKEMNAREHPDFVVNLGDFIEDVNDRDVDIEYFRKTNKLFESLKVPVYALIGNHDVRTLTDKDMLAILNYNRLYYSFDHKDFHFVCLSFTMTGDHRRDLSDIKAEVMSEQLKWLVKDLHDTDKQIVVFIHYGLADDDMKGNFWFESNPHNGLLANRKAVRKILEESGKVKAVISGHQHWNKMNVHNNILYFVITSLVENFKNDGTAAEAHTIVNLNEEKIIVDVKGNDPAKFEYVFISGEKAS